jgi:hypothetical protein
MTTIRPAIDSDLIEEISDLIETTGLTRPTSISEAIHQIIDNWTIWAAKKETSPDSTEKLTAENRTLYQRIKQLEKANENLRDGDASDILELRKIELKEKIHEDSLTENKKDRELKTVLKTADALIDDRKEKYKILREVVKTDNIDVGGLVEELLSDSAAVKIMRDVPALIENGTPLADPEEKEAEQ